MEKHGNSGNGFTRKVQKLGASSLIITLPRGWARRHNVNVGDSVLVYDDGYRLVVVPDGLSEGASLNINISRSTYSRHIGRVILCGYIFGLDEIEGLGNRSLKDDVRNRIWKSANMLDSVDISLRDGNKTIDVKYPDFKENPEDAIVDFGKEVSKIIGGIASFLKNPDINIDVLLDKQSDIMKKNYKILRIVNSIKPISSMDDIRSNYLKAVAELLGVVADLTFRLAIDIKRFYSSLRDNERERLAFLLEIMEIATATMIGSLKINSVKKSEDAYWKIKTIIDIEEEVDNIISGSTPAFAFLLSRILDVARILEIVENALLCLSLTLKDIGENGH